MANTFYRCFGYLVQVLSVLDLFDARALRSETYSARKVTSRLGGGVEEDPEKRAVSMELLWG